jgi:hypothetical protein
MHTGHEFSEAEKKISRRYVEFATRGSSCRRESTVRDALGLIRDPWVYARDARVQAAIRGSGHVFAADGKLGGRFDAHLDAAPATA